MKLVLLLITAIVLAGCQINQHSKQSGPPQLKQLEGADDFGAEHIASVSADGARWVIASEHQGLRLLGGQGESSITRDGRYSVLDARPHKNQSMLLATVDAETNVPSFFQLSRGASQFEPVHQLPAPGYQVEGLCLYQDTDQNLFVLLLDGEGAADQWLVYSGKEQRYTAQSVRRMALPPQSEYCNVDDVSGRLFVTEEMFGVWQYNVDPEADQQRQLVDAVAPYGTLTAPMAGVAGFPGGVSVLTPKTGGLHVYHFADNRWQKRRQVSLTNGAAAEAELQSLAWHHQSEAAHFGVVDDESGMAYEGSITFALGTPGRPASGKIYATVQPSAETIPVNRFGDAADDPAVWVHRRDPSQSLVLGTDKKWGLRVYNLAGDEVQALPSGRVNNVDLRQEVTTAAGIRDLAVASNRTDNTITVYNLDRRNGQVTELGRVPTSLDEIYGVCLYHDKEQQRLFAFANSKDGAVAQYQLEIDAPGVAGHVVREFALTSQPEGCVVDDERGLLYVGEEDKGVWLTSAAPDHSEQPELIVAIGEHAEADIEGLALYQRGTANYLVVSSQGNDSYAVYDAARPFAWIGSFRVGLNAAAGIDGASETDGLEVIGANLGGIYHDGLLVVQDGRNVMPSQPQNFKLVPWSAISDELKLAP